MMSSAPTCTPLVLDKTEPQDGCGLESLAFLILALHGLVICSTIKDASVPIGEKYTKKLSALQEEFFTHEGLFELFLDSSFQIAAAAWRFSSNSSQVPIADEMFVHWNDTRPLSKESENTSLLFILILSLNQIFALNNKDMVEHIWSQVEQNVLAVVYSVNFCLYSYFLVWGDFHSPLILLLLWTKEINAARGGGCQSCQFLLV